MDNNRKETKDGGIVSFSKNCFLGSNILHDSNKDLQSGKEYSIMCHYHGKIHITLEISSDLNNDNTWFLSTLANNCWLCTPMTSNKTQKLVMYGDIECIRNITFKGQGSAHIKMYEGDDAKTGTFYNKHISWRL